jgi:beta-mannosidase
VHGYWVDVLAEVFVKDLVLNVDRLDPGATVDDQIVTLLPGERHRFVVTSDADLDSSALSTHPVLQAVNSLVHPGVHVDEHVVAAMTRK